MTNTLIQIGAQSKPISLPVDEKLMHLVQNKSANGWGIQDTDRLVRSGQLNDQPPLWTGKRNGDEYGNVTEGGVIRPMMAKADDMRTKVVIGGVEFKFTGTASRDHFKSEIGRWFALNAKADAPAGGAGQNQAPVGQVGQVSQGS